VGWKKGRGTHNVKRKRNRKPIQNNYGNVGKGPTPEKQNSDREGEALAPCVTKKGDRFTGKICRPESPKQKRKGGGNLAKPKPKNSSRKNTSTESTQLSQSQAGGGKEEKERWYAGETSKNRKPPSWIDKNKTAMLWENHYGPPNNKEKEEKKCENRFFIVVQITILGEEGPEFLIGTLQQFLVGFSGGMFLMKRRRKGRSRVGRVSGQIGGGGMKASPKRQGL